MYNFNTNSSKHDPMQMKKKEEGGRGEAVVVAMVTAEVVIAPAALAM